MEQRVNYQRRLEEVLERERGSRPRLLLHCCCAPCSSYVLEYLREHFEIDLFFYNPNIAPAAEFDHRRQELWRLADEMGLGGQRVAPPYDPQEFLNAAAGLEDAPEGGARCRRCFELRLGRAAREAAARGCRYFATTLTLSPLKNAQLLNAIGEEMGRRYGVAWLWSDFKKRDGYKRSLVLSQQYGLYRQDYCGCVFSQEERRRQKAAREQEP